MLRNYFRIGFRNLLKNKLFSLINIGGMAMSMASFFVIGLFIYDEYKYDRHIADVSLKYRIFIDLITTDGRSRVAATIPPPFGQTLVAEYPEVESSVRFLPIGANVLFMVGEKKIAEPNGAYADPTVFEMFSIPLLEGSLATSLREPASIAISESLARKYFGDEPALGRQIQFESQPYTVSAVYEDLPAQSHIQLNYMLSMESLERAIPERMKTWGWQQFITYIKVKPGTDAAQLEVRAQEMTERYNPREKAGGYYYIPHLMPMADVHLHATTHEWDIAVKGNVQTVYILSAVAIFILIIAILNFVNLSTARAVSRMKEVGVRKVVGAYRAQLIYQFISESVIIAFIALVIGGLLTELLLPGLNSFTGKSIPTGIFINPVLLIVVSAFALMVGLSAGAYPAFYVSGYTPAHILSNKQSGRSGKVLMRKGLVVLQFILSFFLITASLVVSEQHRFMRNRDGGFKKENLVVVPIRGDMYKNLEAAKNTFVSHPNIISGSLGYGLPGEAYSTDNIRDLINNKDITVSMLTVDHDYAVTLGLQLIGGRNFSEDFPSDIEEAFIISASAASALGYTNPADALQHDLGCNRWREGTLKKGKVIGVVKDFHLNSLRENISPVVFHIYPQGYSWLAMRIKPDGIPATLEHLEAAWKKFNTDWPFEYKFLDESIDKMYKSEEKLASLFGFFTAFTIFVACLGLFGLVVYSTTQKYKEISIRKVLGAEVTTLVVQLSKSYISLIAIAFVIAIPFSYYAADQWLNKFAFRIPITPMLFIQAGLLIMVISLLTVGIQSFNAARTNPVDALKEQ